MKRSDEIKDFAIPATPRIAARDLATPRDFWRYAVTRFQTAGLDYGHGTDNALDEAAFIVLEGLSLPIDNIEPWLDCALTRPERKRLAALIEARVKTRKPASYLLNRAYIQGYPFYVDERAIVPRSFIGEILFTAQNPTQTVRQVESILDLCTGSGCLAILAAQLHPQAVIDAVELSPDALAVARINVAQYNLAERLTLHHGDLFAPVAGNKYDIIIANPPYVDDIGMQALHPEHRHEPAMALYGGSDDGMALVRRILDEALDHLNPGGGLLCEIGRGRAAIAAAYAHLPLRWLDTAHSEGEVFWIDYDGLRAASRAA